MKRLREWLAVIAFLWLLGSVGACETGNITIGALFLRIVITVLVVGMGYLVTKTMEKGK